MKDLQKPKVMLVKELQELRALVDSLLARESNSQNQNRNRSDLMENVSAPGLVIPQIPQEMSLYTIPIGSFFVDRQTTILEETPYGAHLFEPEKRCLPGSYLADMLDPDVRDTLLSLIAVTAPFERRMANCTLWSNHDKRNLVLSVSRLRMPKQTHNQPLFMVTFWDIPNADPQQGDDNNAH